MTGAGPLLVTGVVVLRTARFFPRTTTNPGRRMAFETLNLQANELLYRRADVDDVVEAHRCALEKASALGFRRYVVSARTPFSPDDVVALRADAAALVRRRFPEVEALYAARGWRLPSSLDRVYDSRRAIRELDWRPTCDFAHVLACLREGRDFRSKLARAVGSKGYHDIVFTDGPYPVE